MNIQTVEIDHINPAVYNPRLDLKPGDPDYEKLKKSIAEFDLIEPLIWNKRSGNLVGGHQRLKILQERGDTVVEVSVVDLDDIKEKALNLALNKISGEWDYRRLKDLLEELDTGAFDMEITGFDLKEIEDLMTRFHVPEEGLTDDDALPDAVESICRRGDLWSLGNHRLLCGDATVITDVERLIGGEKADMVFTDPPYGIDLDTDYSQLKSKLEFVKDKHLKHKTGNKYNPIEGDDIDFDPSSLLMAFDYCLDIFLWGGDYYHKRLPDGGSLFVWDKRETEQFDKMYGSAFEICWSKTRHRREIIRHTWAGVFGTEQEDIRGRVHPTQKPVGLCEWFISKFSKLGNIVIDLFGGSGSTLIACEKLGRLCYMMEIDEHYCDVIIQRWQNFTGRQAVKL